MLTCLNASLGHGHILQVSVGVPCSHSPSISVVYCTLEWVTVQESMVPLSHQQRWEITSTINSVPGSFPRESGTLKAGISSRRFPRHALRPLD